MTTIVHGPAAVWATAHRTLLILLAVTLAAVAAVAVVLAVQQTTDEPATGTTGSVVPAGAVDPACVDDTPMTGAFC